MSFTKKAKVKTFIYNLRNRFDEKPVDFLNNKREDKNKISLFKETNKIFGFKDDYRFIFIPPKRKKIVCN